MAQPTDRTRWLAALALALILVGAGAARFVDLPSNPGGLYPDEAAEAVSARQILRDPTYRPVFIAADGGREALFAYTVAAGFAVAGETVATLRGVSALWGVLGVLGIWLLARRFGRGAGLAAATWAAGSLWLIALSRDGMRNMITPFFCAVALLAVLAWLDRPTRRMAAVAGAVFAVSTLYTYQALKLLPLLGLVWLLWLRRVDHPAFRRLLATGSAFLAAFAIVGAPMILAALSDLPAYLGRGIGVTPFNPELVPGSDLATHMLRTLGMFAFVGDPNPRHDVAALPLLDWPIALLALGGVAVTWTHIRDGRPALILLSLPVFLLPPLIATEGGAPHFLRALGLAAPLGVVIGIGAQESVRRLPGLVARAGAARAGASAARSNRLKGAAAVAVGAVLVIVGISATSTYLSRPISDRYTAFSYELVAMTELARGTNDVVIANDFEAFTIQFVGDAAMPRIVSPGTAIDQRSADRVLAVRLSDLPAAVGPELAATAEPVAWDPLGQPTVWAVALE